jgi:hypothetical protein
MVSLSHRRPAPEPLSVMEFNIGTVSELVCQVTDTSHAWPVRVACLRDEAAN